MQYQDPQTEKTKLTLSKKGKDTYVPTFRRVSQKQQKAFKSQEPTVEPLLISSYLSRGQPCDNNCAKYCSVACSENNIKIISTVQFKLGLYNFNITLHKIYKQNTLENTFL
jgi:hypothetical protein